MKKKCHGSSGCRDYTCTDGKTSELHQQSKKLAMGIAGFQKKQN
jgi:hypothetical protein